MRSGNATPLPAAVGGKDRLREAQLQPVMNLAASMFESPTAYAYFVADKQLVYLSSSGLELAVSAENGDLMECALKRESPVLIHDLDQDASLAEHPQVRSGPRFRFLAATQLRRMGQVIGTLGVLDTRPHEAADQASRNLALDRLNQLAAVAESLLAVCESTMEEEAWSDIGKAGSNEGEQNLTQFTLDNIDSDVLWVRKDGTITYVNNAFCNRSGFRREELLQKKPFDLDPVFDARRVREIFERVKNHGSINIDARPRRKDGSCYDSLATISFIRQGDDEFLCVIGQDITHRKQVEGELRRVKHAMDHLADAAFWVDRKGAIHYANHTAALQLGYSRESLSQMALSDIDPALTPQSWDDRWRQAKQQGILAFEGTHRRQDGTTCCCDVRLSFLTFGREELIFATARDITEQKKQSGELKKTRTRLQAALSGAQIGLWDWNIQTSEVYVSPELNAQLGEQPNSWNRIDDFQSRLHPDDVLPANKAISDYLEGRRDDYENIFRLRHMDGGYRWFLSRGKLFRDDHNNPVRFIGTHVDITDRKQDETRLAKDLIRSGSLLRASREVMTVGSIAELAERVPHQIRELLAAHQAMLTFRRGERWRDAVSGVSMSIRYSDEGGWDDPLADAGVYDCVCNDNRPVLLAHDQLEQQADWVDILRLPPNRRPARGWLAAPLVDRHGKNLGLIQLSDRYDGDFENDDLDLLVQFAYIVSIVADRLQAEEIVHERSEQLEQALTEYRGKSAALRRSNDELQRFAYVASHDLRSPLRGIANLANWIAEDCQQEGVILPSEVETHLQMLTQQVGRMDGLLTGLLEYSRAGRMQYEPERLDLGQLIDEVVSIAGLPPRFKVKRQGGLPTIEAQRSPLERVFLNLITNAFKHHDRDTGLVRIEVEDLGELLRFSVTDDGPGIPQQHHERIFEIYQTLKSKDQVEASGIGLSIVKKLVEYSGGKISVAPNEGRGTTFIFTWPKHAILHATPREDGAKFRG